MSQSALSHSSPETRAEVVTARRVVVKVGSQVLRADDGGPAWATIRSLVAAAVAFFERGGDLAIVTSGAVSTGRSTLGLTDRPLDSAEHSLCAAVGQSRLTALFDRAFSGHPTPCGQLLITRDDLAEPGRRLGFLSGLESMLARRVLPILNENDALTAGRGRHAFQDNDCLAAETAVLMRADLLVLLTSVDGVYERDPSVDASARLVRQLDLEDSSTTIDASGGSSPIGRGGMGSKVQSALLASRRGCAGVIANGRRAGALSHILAGEPLGTWIPPRKPAANEGELR